MRKRLVDRGVVHLDDFFAFLAVGLGNGLFDPGDGLIRIHHVGQFEETDLHDGIDAPAHAGIPGHAVGIDGVEMYVLVDDLLLQSLRQFVPQFIGAVGAVQ